MNLVPPSAATLLYLVSGHALLAAPLLTNTDQSPSAYDSTVANLGYYNGDHASDNEYLGFGIITSDKAWEFDSIDLSLGHTAGTPDVTIGVWKGNASGIDRTSGEVASLTKTAGTYSTTDYSAITFSAAHPFRLEADTTYYFVARQSGDYSTHASAYLELTASSATTGLGSLADTNYGYYQYYCGTEGYWAAADGANFVFSINGNIIPEPSASAVFSGLAGLGALACTRFRKRKLS